MAILGKSDEFKGCEELFLGEVGLSLGGEAPDFLEGTWGERIPLGCYH